MDLWSALLGELERRHWLVIAGIVLIVGLEFALGMGPDGEPLCLVLGVIGGFGLMWVLYQWGGRALARSTTPPGASMAGTYTYEVDDGLLDEVDEDEQEGVRIIEGVSWTR